MKIYVVEIPNSKSISCSNISLLECSLVTQAARVRFHGPRHVFLGRGALVEDGDDLRQTPSKLYLIIFRLV